MSHSAHLNQAAQYQAALVVLQVLEEAGYQARLVGGCVRDRLLGLEPKDYDLATDALPERLLELFGQKPFKVIATGLAHGTVTVVYHHWPFEVTSLRQDLRSYGRHAEVAFGGSFAEDATRRDFTINAMYEDRQGVLYDYYEGHKHLKAGKLVFVGDPKTRLEEDYLRVLRFFRFKSRYHLDSDPNTLLALKEAASGLALISQERITSELWEIFTVPDLAGCLKPLVETGVLRQALSRLFSVPLQEAGLPLAEWRVTDSCFGVFSQLGAGLVPAHRARARLALLFFWHHLQAQQDVLAWTETQLSEGLRRFKLATAHVQAVTWAVLGLQSLPASESDIATQLDFIDRCELQAGKQSWPEFFLPFWSRALPLLGGKGLELLGCLKRADAAEQRYGQRRVQALPVKAKQLMTALQLQPGPELGKLLEYLKRAFRNGEWQSWEEAKLLSQSFREKGKKNVKS